MVNLYVMINRLIDSLMGPLEGVSPIWPLAIWSIVVGVVAMIIYKYTSKQDGIKDAKDKIKGHFYEVWLYIDDAPVIAKAQLKVMFNAFRYMAYAAPPLAIMIVLFFPLFANLETRYAMKPVPVGDETLVKLRLAREFDGWQNQVKLDLPPGVELVGNPVRFSRRVFESDSSKKVVRVDHEVNYKLKATEPGRHDLAFTVKGKSFTVPFLAGPDYGKRATPLAATTSLGEALLFPPTAKVPAEADVERVEIKYPEADFPFLGWNAWWIWPFLIISMIAAYAVKGVFKVEI